MNQLALVINQACTGQKEDILNYLKIYPYITRKESFDQLGICELASRIGELEADGYVFDKDWLKGRAPNGRKWRVRTYANPRRCRDA